VRVRKNILKLVNVIWEDVLEDPSWATDDRLEQFANNEKTHVFQVGLLVKETKEHVLLANSFIIGTSPFEAGGITKIPKKLIVSIKELKKVDVAEGKIL
jgi:hypothetical protein